MDRIEGLKEYVKTKQYRTALGLPGEQKEEYVLLAQGEYNMNYRFTHPVTGRELLLRVNCGSQMHLADQIGYEAHALKLLEGSGRTPEVLYVDGSKKEISRGVLVMEYLPGRTLNYHTELSNAAACLADIHSVRIPEAEDVLIRPGKALHAILSECEEMFRVYEESPLGDDKKKKRIREMLSAGWQKAEKMNVEGGYQCCINTELNSTNFLINGGGKTDYLIDWEKPLYGNPAQDLGHFLAPTTTFWKTDVILSPKTVEAFIDEYICRVDGRFDTGQIREHTHAFIPITCLRGITWCAMAWVQYQNPDKLIVNESTSRKLEAYLDMEFLENIYNEYLR